MLLWIAIAALWLATALARPRILARLVVRPMRRPGEATRSLRWRTALGRLGFAARDWRLDLTDLQTRGGAPAPLFSAEVAATARQLRPVNGPAEPRHAKDRQSLYLWTATRPRDNDAERQQVKDDGAPPMLVLTHGYSDSSASMGAVAVAGARMGLPSLFVDQMGHGLSGVAACSYGWREADHLRRLLLAAKATLPNETRGGFVVVGWSMGAAIAIQALAKMSAEERTNLRGVALGAPYADFGQALRRQAGRLFGLRSERAVAKARRLAEEQGGFRAEDVGPADALRSVAKAKDFPPALFLRGAGDTLVDREEIAELAGLWPGGEAEAAEIAGAAHDNLWRVAGATEALAAWLARRRDSGGDGPVG